MNDSQDHVPHSSWPARVPKIMGVALTTLAVAVMGLSIKVFFFLPTPQKIAFVDMDAVIRSEAQYLSQHDPSQAGLSQGDESRDGLSQRMGELVSVLQSQVESMAKEDNCIVLAKKMVLSGGLDKTALLQLRLNEVSRQQKPERRSQ